MTAPSIKNSAKTVLDAVQTSISNNISGILTTANTNHSLTLTAPARYRRSEILRRDFESPDVAIFTNSERLRTLGLFAYDVEQTLTVRITLSAVGEGAETETELWDSLAVYMWSIAHCVQLYAPSETDSPIYVIDPVAMTPGPPLPLTRAGNHWIQQGDVQFVAKYRARHRAA